MTRTRALPLNLVGAGRLRISKGVAEARASWFDVARFEAVHDLPATGTLAGIASPPRVSTEHWNTRFVTSTLSARLLL